MHLVRVCKRLLQRLRDSGWDSLLKEVSLFCKENNIDIPNMDERYAAIGRSRRHAEGITNLHHYQVQIFYVVIDVQLQDLNSRFNEVNTQLLLCMAALDPKNLFAAFDKDKIIEFAKFYPSDFCPIDLIALDVQLDTYFEDMSTDDRFLDITGIHELSQKMVETGKHLIYQLVYRLLKLALILPVATASVERAFSAMKIVKASLRNQMGDDWFNDCLITYVEKEIFSSIDNETIMERFQNMRSRRGVL